ncbi:unnamed protein product [Macrosiphum euphorbiae]|uniref:F-box domain-containing protein n=1 Tax=Macrosiphum euphorbiae TaxID=13131 RepID=A0AAV0W578_9HEMI|nr:unnamed protein product [Macrosiphum euphorbiae]
MDVCDAPQPQYFLNLVFDIIFENLKLSDLYSYIFFCRKWNRAINGDRTEPWKSLCRREFTEGLLNSKHLSPLQNHKDKLRALSNSWKLNENIKHEFTGGEVTICGVRVDGYDESEKKSLYISWLFLTRLSGIFQS